MPIPLLAIYGGIAVAKAGFGAYQYLKGKELARNNNIDNQVVSQEAKKNLSLAERMAREGMPEPSYRKQEEAINRGTTLGLRQLSTGRNQAGNVASLITGANKSMQSLNEADANQRLKNQSLVMRYNEMIGNEKRRGFEQEAMAAQGMMGAGIQNLGGALDAVGTGALAAAELEVDGETGAGKVPKDISKPLGSRRSRRSLFSRNLGVVSPNQANA